MSRRSSPRTSLQPLGGVLLWTSLLSPPLVDASEIQFAMQGAQERGGGGHSDPPDVWPPPTPFTPASGGLLPLGSAPSPLEVSGDMIGPRFGSRAVGHTAHGTSLLPSRPLCAAAPIYDDACFVPARALRPGGMYMTGANHWCREVVPRRPWRHISLVAVARLHGRAPGLVSPSVGLPVLSAPPFTSHLAFCMLRVAGCAGDPVYAKPSRALLAYLGAAEYFL